MGKNKSRMPNPYHKFKWRYGIPERATPKTREKPPKGLTITEISMPSYEDIFGAIDTETHVGVDFSASSKDSTVITVSDSKGSTRTISVEEARAGIGSWSKKFDEHFKAEWPDEAVFDDGLPSTVTTRQTGWTTRLADFAIQELFTQRKTVIKDHHPTDEADEHLFNIVKRRLHFEHSHVIRDLIFEKTREGRVIRFRLGIDK